MYLSFLIITYIIKGLYKTLKINYYYLITFLELPTLLIL